jgi:hypothetical protein
MAQGRADAARMGAYFRASGLVFDLALVSPARRARDTFDMILRELSQKPACELEASLYNAGVDTLRDRRRPTRPFREFLQLAGGYPCFAVESNRRRRDRRAGPAKSGGRNPGRSKERPARPRAPGNDFVGSNMTKSPRLTTIQGSFGLLVLPTRSRRPRRHALLWKASLFCL